MAIQLTPEQEQRIQAIVNVGAYPSAEEALDAGNWQVSFWRRAKL